MIPENPPETDASYPVVAIGKRPIGCLKTVDDDGIVVGVSAKRSRAGEPVLRKLPFKGNRVELASTTGIQRFDDIAEDFMFNVSASRFSCDWTNGVRLKHDERRVDECRKTAPERKYGTWRDLPDGGRLYSHDVKGRSGWLARYLKQVDAEETTVRFHQEVFDGDGRLRDLHEKFPVDLGHRRMIDEES